MSRKCTLCQAKEKEVLANICSNMQILGAFFKKVPTNVVSCRNCGLVYVDIDATQEDFNNYYTSDNCCPFSYNEVYGAEYTQQYFSTILKNMEKYCNSNSYIIDVGAGLGEFGEFLKQKGYKNVYALDINEKAIKSINEKGIHAIKSDIFQIDHSLKNKFDVAIVSHTLEHWLDMDKALINTKELLKDDGYLYIEVPDAEAYCDTNSVPYTMFTYEHLYHFTLDTLKNVARAWGFTLLAEGQFFKANSYGVIYGLYAKNDVPASVTLEEKCAAAIKKYEEHSINKLRASVSEFEKTQEPLILWGIGSSTALLLNNTFNNCNVIQLIDRSPTRQNIEYAVGQGKTLLIQDPVAIKNEEATIVVLPYWYNQSIMAQIKEMGFKNPIKTLME